MQKLLLHSGWATTVTVDKRAHPIACADTKPGTPLAACRSPSCAAPSALRALAKVPAGKQLPLVLLFLGATSTSSLGLYKPAPHRPKPFTPGTLLPSLALLAGSFKMLPEGSEKLQEQSKTGPSTTPKKEPSTTRSTESLQVTAAAVGWTLTAAAVTGPSRGPDRAVGG